MGATISIITLSLIISYLCYRLIPMALELGELRKERETMVVPEIKHLRRSEEQLLMDIEKIVEGDKYITDIWKERIGKRKKSNDLLLKMFSKNE